MFNYSSGIILFELLTIIPSAKWYNSLITLKHGGFPPQSNLQEVEKRLIRHLLSSNPEDRPKSIDLIDIVATLMQKG